MPGASRQTEMSIDLGDDQIALERIDSLEALSMPFTVMVDILSPLEIDLAPHLGKPCALKVMEDDQLQRYFHGLVVSAEHQGDAQGAQRYRLTLRPWTYFLAQNRNMAIFQDKSAVDIIKAVFEANGVSDSEFKLASTPSPRLYCVQYQESDFAFVSRLMEEEGIYYYFRHEAARHVMVLCDAPTSHGDGSPATLRHNPSSVSVFSVDSQQRSKTEKSYLQSWAERVSTNGEAKVSIRDYDFMSPEQPLKAEMAQERGHPHDDREVYHYPGGFAREQTSRDSQESGGRARSKAMIEGLRAQRRVFTGTAQAASIACGTKVTVENHPVSRMNAAYMIVSTYHTIVSETLRSGVNDREAAFNVRFEAIPAETPYRAHEATPRPTVQGLESAVVTGPEGEEIFTDEYGRVKVRFHWDRASTPGENSTCWIRVSQTGGLGNIILPRVGHEVLVDFLGGDPDRPVVVGRVFNKAYMPVYDLPANKTRALWRTKRYGETGSYPQTKSLDTGAPGANEIRFEDKGGVEELFVHAERDMNTRVRFDETHHVGHDQTIMIGNDRQEEVIGFETIKINKDRKEQVVQNEEVKIDQSQKLKVGIDRDTKIGTSDTINVGTAYKLTANTSIEIVVGASKIKMDPMGITIESPMITIDGKITTDVKSLMTTVNASAILTLKGALTLIN